MQFEYLSKFITENIFNNDSGTMTNGFTKFVENNFKLAINDKEFLMIFIVDFIVFNNNFQQLFQKPLSFFVELMTREYSRNTLFAIHGLSFFDCFLYES